MLVEKCTRVLSLYQLILTYVSLCYAQSLSSSECRDLGFSSNTLQCSSCDELKEFKLTQLEKSCKKCCIQDTQSGQESEIKYSKAILEICSWKVGRYPQVQAFIRERLSKYHPSLSVLYTRGKDPVLIIYDENDEEVENLSIDKWNTDTISEYLDKILVSSN